MSRGLIAKAVHETWPATLLFALALAALEALLGYIVPMFFENYREFADYWLEIQFIRDMIEALLGTELGDTIGPGLCAPIPWVHMVVLALLWAHGVVICIRMPAGEVDCGTIDVLFGLPVSRTRMYVSETAVWLASGLVVIAAGLLGNLIGGWSTAPELKAAPGPLFMVITNLYCLYVAAGALARLVSACSDRRGRAVAVVFGIVLASFFLNFLAQFWAPAKSVSFLSVLTYYRPLHILRDAAWPVTNMLVLCTTAAVLWLAGAIIFARRDICTN